MQLALLKGEVAGDDVAELRAQLSDEYPSRDHRMNRELVRLLVYLQEPTFAERLVEQLKSDLPSVEKMQLLMHARFLQAGWTMPLQAAKCSRPTKRPARCRADTVLPATSKTCRAISSPPSTKRNGNWCWPTARSGRPRPCRVLAKLPEHPERGNAGPDSEARPAGEEARQRGGQAAADRHLRRAGRQRRPAVRWPICASCSTTSPIAACRSRWVWPSSPTARTGPTWCARCRSSKGSAAQEVLMRLAQVDRVPEEPEAYPPGDSARSDAARKRQPPRRRTAGKMDRRASSASRTTTWDKSLAAWQDWFVEKYPNLPEPKLPVDAEQNHWTYQELLSFLTGPQASQGVAARGAVLFEKAQCIKCHRYGDRGDTVGPDLTNVSKRFQKKEILESILFPSHVISDQYRQPDDRDQGRQDLRRAWSRRRGDGSLDRVAGQRREDTCRRGRGRAEATRTKVSSMPDGLLNTLTLEEIADLFAYLGAAAATRKSRGGRSNAFRGIGRRIGPCGGSRPNSSTRGGVVPCCGIAAAEQRQAHDERRAAPRRALGANRAAVGRRRSTGRCSGPGRCRGHGFSRCRDLSPR